MNPFYQTIMGANSPVPAQAGQTARPQGGTPFGGINGVLQRAQQIASSFQNPQELVQRFIPDAPQEISGDPDQIISWLQQTGRINPQTVQMARQMMGR